MFERGWDSFCEENGMEFLLLVWFVCAVQRKKLHSVVITYLGVRISCIFLTFHRLRF
jgi:hypothetical protein